MTWYARCARDIAFTEPIACGRTELNVIAPDDAHRASLPFEMSTLASTVASGVFGTGFLQNAYGTPLQTDPYGRVIGAPTLACM